MREHEEVYKCGGASTEVCEGALGRVKVCKGMCVRGCDST